MRFSAVILAGGRSTRMGRDKAWLPLDGKPLLARQIELVRGLEPAELFISGRTGIDYTSFGCPVLADRFPDAGPLAGIERALEMATTTLLLVLAVDLPQMTWGCLNRLAASGAGGLGVIPRHSERIEPLAAIYPTAARSIALTLLGEECRAATTFAERCVHAGLANFHELAPDEVGCFANWNSPADLLAISAKGAQLVTDQIPTRRSEVTSIPWPN